MTEQPLTDGTGVGRKNVLEARRHSLLVLVMGLLFAGVA